MFVTVSVCLVSLSLSVKGWSLFLAFSVNNHIVLTNASPCVAEFKDTVSSAYMIAMFTILLHIDKHHVFGEKE